MHIEPGVVDGAKILLSYATAAVAFGFASKLVTKSLREEGGLLPFMGRSTITTALVFSFFEVLPHHPVGVSEVHLILGSMLLLMFGAGAASTGLALGLLIQGVFFAPFDLPQYGMNVTTLLVPLWGISLLAKKIIPARTAYVDIKYAQAFLLSASYQGGIIAWVAFWALYGHGFSVQNLGEISSFGLAYMSVVLIEPFIDLAVLAAAKTFSQWTNGALFVRRLHNAA